MPKGPARTPRERFAMSVSAECDVCGYRISYDATYHACGCDTWHETMAAILFHMNEYHSFNEILREP